MSKGNFDLKYNTNVPQLRDEMIRDHNFVEHGSKTEKVLGYEYSPETDTIKEKVSKIKAKAVSKREVLSETSKVFDPLSLCLTVTIRGRLLLRDLWERQLDWDEKIPEGFQKAWSTMSYDLNGHKMDN